MVHTDNEVLCYFTRGSHYQYIACALFKSKLGLFISTKKWPMPRPCYPYTVRITRYVQINFVLIVNQTCGSRYLYCAHNENIFETLKVPLLPYFCTMIGLTFMTTIIFVLIKMNNFYRGNKFNLV